MTTTSLAALTSVTATCTGLLLYALLRDRALAVSSINSSTLAFSERAVA